MVEWITTIITAIQSNPIVAGIFGTTVLAGVATYFRNIPRQIFNFLYNFLTVKMVFDQIDKTETTGEIKNRSYRYFFSELIKYKSFTFNNTKDVKTSYNYDDQNIPKEIKERLYNEEWEYLDFIPTIGVRYYTIIQGVLVQYYLSEIDNKMQRYFILNLRFFTRNIDKVEKIVFDLIKQNAQRNSKNYNCFNYNSGSRWIFHSHEVQFSQNPFMLTEQQEGIYQKIAIFLNSKEKYKKLCKPYHTGFIFHGKPGCGKSQFVKKLAEEFQLNIYVLNLGICTDSSLIELIQSLPARPCIVLIEDVDRYSFNGEYKVIPQKKEDDGINFFSDEEEKQNDQIQKGVSFSTVLNIIDGIYGVNNGTIFIATTNHFNSLDPAFIRPGRFDYCLEFDFMNKKEICNFLHIQYENNNLIELRDDIRLPISVVSNLCFECSTVEDCVDRINSLH